MKRRSFLTGLAAAPVALWAHGSQACSLVFVNNYKKKTMPKIVVRAMDLPASFPEMPLFFIFPRKATRDSLTGTLPGIKAQIQIDKNENNRLKWTSQYGSVGIVSFFGGMTDGMNEHGLSAHLLVLETSITEAPDGRAVLPDGLWAQYVLDNFKTVDEAVAAHRDPNSFRIVPSWSADVGMCKALGVHLAVQDASGNSAIFEHVNGQLVIHQGEQYRVMTNDPPLDVMLNRWKVYASSPSLEQILPGGVNPEERFIRLMTYHQRLPEPDTYQEAVGGAMSLLRIAQVPFREPKQGEGLWGAVQTNWIAASDMSNKIYYANSATVPSLFWLDLNKVNFSPKQSLRFLNPHDLSIGGDALNHLQDWNEDNPTIQPVSVTCPSGGH